MKKKESCCCQVCDEQFLNITDQMLHYMREHDDGYKERHERRKRNLYCGACREFTISHETLICSCGQAHWTLKRKEATNV